jgi:hypothetical protein
MNFNLEKNAILCLNEAWIKYKDAKKDKNQYLFVFKELASFIELYCKFIIKTHIISDITDIDLQKIEFQDSYGKLAIHLKNSGKITKQIKKLREIRNKLFHFEYILQNSEIKLFPDIIKEFEVYIASNFENSIEKSCYNYGFDFLYSEIMTEFYDNLYEVKLALADQDWEKITKIYHTDELKEIYEENHSYISLKNNDFININFDEINHREEDEIIALITSFMSFLYNKDSCFIINLYDVCDDIAYGQNLCENCNYEDTLIENDGILCVVCLKEPVLTECNNCNMLTHVEVYYNKEEDCFEEDAVSFCSDDCRETAFKD